MTEVASYEELAKLTLRALVAYSTRCARRIASSLPSTPDMFLIERAILQSEEVATAPELRALDGASILRTGAEIVGLAKGFDLLQHRRAALAVALTTVVAHAALDASTDRPRANKHAAYAIRFARDVTAKIDIFDQVRTAVVAEATRNDYEALLRLGGTHEWPTPGEPIDLSEGSLLGPL
jgi:hypothetical protein